MFYQLLHWSQYNMSCDNYHVHYYTESKSVGIFHAIHIKIDILEYISIWSKIACNVAPVSTRRVDIPAGIPIHREAVDDDVTIWEHIIRAVFVVGPRRAPPVGTRDTPTAVVDVTTRANTVRIVVISTVRRAIFLFFLGVKYIPAGTPKYIIMISNSGNGDYSFER